MLRFTSPIFVTSLCGHRIAIVHGIFLAAMFFLASNAVQAHESWPQWRGPNQNGFAGDGEFPVRWDEQGGVMWKNPIPGSGASTPVVSGSTVYVTSGIDGQNSLIAMSVDDGASKWTTSIGEDRGGKHRKGGGANPSAVIKGDHLYAYFRSGDLACVNLDGKIVWQVNVQEKFSPDTLGWDLGTSPLVTDHLTLHGANDGTMTGRWGELNPDQITNFRSISSPVASRSTIRS